MIYGGEKAKKENQPNIARRPQAAQRIKDNPTDPERSSIPPGVTNIPDPDDEVNIQQLTTRTLI